MFTANLPMISTCLLALTDLCRMNPVAKIVTTISYWYWNLSNKISPQNAVTWASNLNNQFCQCQTHVQFQCWLICVVSSIHAFNGTSQSLESKNTCCAVVLGKSPDYHIFHNGVGCFSMMVEIHMPHVHCLIPTFASSITIFILGSWNHHFRLTPQVSINRLTKKSHEITMVES